MILVLGVQQHVVEHLLGLPVQFSPRLTMLLEISIRRTEEEPSPSTSQLLDQQFVVGHASGLKRRGNRSTTGTLLNPRSRRLAGDINSNPTVNESKIKIWTVSKQFLSPSWHLLPKESQLPKPSSCSIITQGRDACILCQERLVSGSNYPRAQPGQSFPRQSHDQEVLSPTPKPICPPLQVPIIPSQHYDTISEIDLIFVYSLSACQALWKEQLSLLCSPLCPHYLLDTICSLSLKRNQNPCVLQPYLSSAEEKRNSRMQRKDEIEIPTNVLLDPNSI